MQHLVSFLIAFVFTLSACAQKSFDEKLEELYKNTVPLISSDSLKQRMKAGNLVIIDTRAEAEYLVSHLPGAQFLDYDNYSKRDLKGIPKDAEVIVYCSVGYRSERVGEAMLEMGFENVCNLYGGIFDWKNKDYQVVNDRNQPTDSVHTYNKNWSKWLEKGVKVY